MDDKDKRIQELEKVAMRLFNMIHETDKIEFKIEANKLYDIIKQKKE